MTVQPLSPSVSLIVLPLHPVTEEISMGDIRDFKVIIIPVTTGWVLRILYHSILLPLVMLNGLCIPRNDQQLEQKYDERHVTSLLLPV